MIILASLLFTVIALTAACILLPLVLSRTRLARSDAALLAFFAAIGTGFMLIEVSMLQRLIVFLGHPIYSLSVILFALLLAGGLGSYLSTRIADARLKAGGVRVLAVLAAVLAVAGIVTMPLVTSLSDAETPVRIAPRAACSPSWVSSWEWRSLSGCGLPWRRAPSSRPGYGRERRDFGAGVGPRRRHRHGRWHQRQLLDGRRGLPRGARHVRLGRARTEPAAR